MYVLASGRGVSRVSRGGHLALAFLVALAACPSPRATEGSSACGDGTAEAGEACDDGNRIAGDGCSPTCQVERETTPPDCGNGRVESGEACDDGNLDPDDGCTPTCTVRRGWICPGGQACVVHCGDGLTLASEACDDGNMNGGDGCSETCIVEEGWSCEGLECVPICGDGHVRGGETCDDGNQRAGDGCSPSCVARDVWLPLGSSAGSPTVQGPTAVWTGTEMIVWGGISGLIETNSGFRFDPRSRRVVRTHLIDAPTARDRHVAVWTGAEMIVWGGHFYADVLGDGGRYDPRSDTWRALNPMSAPSARGLASGVWTGTELIIWGGYGDPFMTLMGDGGRYDPAADRWRPMPLSGAPTPRVAPVLVWTGSEVLVWGGLESEDPDQVPLRASAHPVDGARFNPTDNLWTPMSARGAAPARAGAGVWAGHELLLIPCLDEGNLLGGARYDPATDLWSAMAPFPGMPAECDATRGSWTGSELVVTSGEHTAIYIPLVNAWTSGPSSLDLGRGNAAEVWADDEVLVWGGWSTLPGHAITDGVRWKPGDPGWAPLGAAVGAQQYANSTVLWTGVELILWSGWEVSGHRFDPLTNRWTTMSTLEAPRYRRDHSAVWTGTQMIIWGGQDGRLREDGGIYTPSTDTWRRLSPRPNAPARSRFDHSAVWTGSEMLIWGGTQGIGTTAWLTVDEGWRFDPVLEQWGELSRVGAPSARSRHLAFWTGREMLVVGGIDESDPAALPRNAASYDPELDRWTPIPPPPGLQDLSGLEIAAWTGSRLFAMGRPGWAALYDPLEHAWQRLSNDDAPPTSRASCVWSGSEVIVWGGWDRGVRTNRGGRYDLELERWFPLPTDGAPTARADHSAVWAGSEMIIWGGMDGGLGGRFLR